MCSWCLIHTAIMVAAKLIVIISDSSCKNYHTQFFFLLSYNFQFYNFIIAQKLNGCICTNTVFTLMGWDS